jgi:y4mF family transcriptional regulator
MKLPVTSSRELGQIIRAVRKESGVRLDDLAAITGVSKQFVSDVEHGKPTAQLGRVLRLLVELGIGLSVEVPAAIEPRLAQLRKSDPQQGAA